VIIEVVSFGLAGGMMTFEGRFGRVESGLSTTCEWSWSVGVCDCWVTQLFCRSALRAGLLLQDDWLVGFGNRAAEVD
jgi:hypothetical protein